MQKIADIVRTAAPSSALQLRGEAYGEDGIREFLIDLVAIANAPVEGERYIVTGCDAAAVAEQRILGIDAAERHRADRYRRAAADYIEPPIRLRFDTIEIDDKPVGVFRIGDCQDRPYMMRIDFSETLRRGDAYMRVNDRAVKLGRRQLQGLFEERFRDAVSASTVEVGFAGEILHKDLALTTADLALLPSRVASAKLRQLAAAREGGTTRLVRLTHARLFGTEQPYEDLSGEELDVQIRELGERYRNEDDRFLFLEAAHPVQLVVFNQGDEALHDASIRLSLPLHAAIHVATRPPSAASDDTLGCMLDDDREPDYPVVSASSQAMHVAASIGEIGPGEMVEIFGSPLRLCAEDSLAGRRIGVDYQLFAGNLREPVRGRLRLRFVAGDDSAARRRPA